MRIKFSNIAGCDTDTTILHIIILSSLLGCDTDSGARGTRGLVRPPDHGPRPRGRHPPRQRLHQGRHLAPDQAGGDILQKPVLYKCTVHLVH